MMTLFIGSIISPVIDKVRSETNNDIIPRTFNVHGKQRFKPIIVTNTILHPSPDKLMSEADKAHPCPIMEYEKNPPKGFK